MEQAAKSQAQKRFRCALKRRRAMSWWSSSADGVSCRVSLTGSAREGLVDVASLGCGCGMSCRFPDERACASRSRLSLGVLACHVVLVRARRSPLVSDGWHGMSHCWQAEMSREKRQATRHVVFLAGCWRKVHCLATGSMTCHVVYMLLARS